VGVVTAQCTVAISLIIKSQLLTANGTLVTFETELATWVQTSLLGKHVGLLEAL
jgi:hypothetical protein